LNPRKPKNPVTTIEKRGPKKKRVFHERFGRQTGQTSRASHYLPHPGVPFILAAGIFGMNSLAGMKKSPAAAKDEERALKVEAIRAQPVDSPVVITGYGEVHALKVVPLSPEVSGTIVAIHPRLVAGGIIPMGETLFRIDTRDYDAAVKEARAAEAQWEKRHKAPGETVCHR
jgi:multidrug efflux pump subunit AcrA (membrane-fusion protein)